MSFVGLENEKRVGKKHFALQQKKPAAVSFSKWRVDCGRLVAPVCGHDTRTGARSGPRLCTYHPHVVSATHDAQLVW